MKKTLAARLLAQFEKLNSLYTGGGVSSNSPSWLITVLNFLEANRNDHNLDMKRMGELWHTMNDSASHGNWADQMIRANKEYKNMNIAPVDSI